MWSKESIMQLQGCFESTDWSLFKESSDSLDEYMDAVTAYVNFCIDSCVPKKLIRSYPNQKPWFNKEIGLKVKPKIKAFKANDETTYK